MLNFAKTFVFALVLLSMAFGASAEDSQQKRVLVYESGTKPSVANQQARYELRSVRDKSEYFCKKCEELAFPATSGTKPTVGASKRNEAYNCEHCGKLVWLDKGVELAHTSKQDCDACEKIRQELKSRASAATTVRTVDRGTKPSTQRLQELNR